MDEIFYAKDVDNLLEEHGIIAALFFPGAAEGAIPNETRIVKTNSDPGDSYPDGTGGIILSNQYLEDITAAKDKYGYFVLFDPDPKVPVFIQGNRIRIAE